MESSFSAIGSTQWRQIAPEAHLVCVFRDPATTVASMILEGQTAPYLSNFRLDEEWAESVWLQSYEAILDMASEGDWLFLEYDQLVNGHGLARLEAFVDASLDPAFLDRRLARTRPHAAPSPTALDLYERLRFRAGL